LTEFISLLQFIATSAEYTVLTSRGFTPNIEEKDVNRLNKILYLRAV